MSGKTSLKPFVVILSAKPAARLPKNLGRLELNFPEPSGLKKVLITKIEEESAGTLIQTGLRFRVFLDAENVKDAVDSAKGLTDGIVSFMTMITGRGMEIPREEIAYELTQGAQERDFLQVFYDVPIKLPSRRQVDPQGLIDFIDRQLKLEVPFSEHMTRAIRWYRLGAMVTDVFDQFNCFWIGLEALNPLLQHKLSVKDDLTVCPECGHRWVATPTVSGIRVFIQDKINEGKTLYRNIRQLRNDIMHSTKELRELRESVSAYAPKIGETLFRAICYLLGFEQWETVTHRAILREFPMRGELQGSLIGGEPSSLGADGQDPHFELYHQVKELKLGEDGSATFTVVTSLTASIGPGVKFKPREIRLYGDSETSGAILSKTLRTTDGKETPI
jgi:hypothetical protein